MNSKSYFETGFLVFLGMLTSLSLPPFNYFIINFLTFSLFFLFLTKKLYQKKDSKKFFLYGWLFGFGYFLTNLYWISISLTFQQDLKFFIPLTFVLIPAFLALFYGLASYLFRIFKIRKAVSSFLFFSLIFSFLEFIRGSILTGFPWNLIAYSFSKQLEILNIISIIGTYGFNLLCITLFTSPAIIVIERSRKNTFVFLIILVLPILSYFYGSTNHKKFEQIEKNISELKIRAINSNIAIERFNSESDFVKIIERLIKISEPEKNEKTLYVWPEGIIPNIYQDQLVKYDWLFAEKFNKNHLIAIGINSYSGKNSNKYFNSLTIYDHKLNLIDSYYKNNLVPFGEFIPLEGILKKIGFRTITNNYQSFSEGNDRNIFHLKKDESSLKILPLICYEIIYSGNLFKNQNFDLILNISEDGWFGKSIGPKQHFIHSIFRAIESGKYIIRSANNGITAVVNPIGVVEQKVEYGKAGYIDFYETKKIKSTIFSRLGNKIFFLVIMIYIVLIIFSLKLEKEIN